MNLPRLLAQYSTVHLLQEWWPLKRHRDDYVVLVAP